MLVSTDCAGMGVHVPDLRLVVNVGMMMIEIFSQNCSLLTSTFQDFHGTCGRCPRHLGGPAETRSCKQLAYRCTGQARKIFCSQFFISTTKHATVITTERTARPQASLLEMKFNFFTGRPFQDKEKYKTLVSSLPITTFCKGRGQTEKSIFFRT